ncbi:MAG: DNA-processing protein DprA [Duncaniella sp.]|nr:DNA-processing protein DprA [Muribaculum sp.]MCM1255308.1 DNA-processing protein DprA [Duncaniella sp.]
MTTTDNLLYRIAFASIRGMNPEYGMTLINRIGSEERFFELTESQLSAVMGFKSRIFSFSLRSKAIEEAAIEERFVRDNSISTIYFTDEKYPQRLLECVDAPLMLYGIGDCDLNEARFVSIVGTRHATIYGDTFVENLVSDFATKLDEKIVIVSGLAYGIDIAAHRAALKNGIPTIAVLAHGLNTMYPATHRSTAVTIAKSGGMLLSDYRSVDQIHKGNFLARNRIVAGLCDCLIVAESAKRGGALVTARLAAGYNREVMALPGRISDKYSEGCNVLIASNVAALITSADDVISIMNWRVKETEGTQKDLFINLTPEESAILEVMTQKGDVTIHDLTSRIDIPVHRLMGLLIDMEFRSLIASIPGGLYRKI